MYIKWRREIVRKNGARQKTQFEMNVSFFKKLFDLFWGRGS